MTIVVTCTDRKSLPVSDDLRIRNLKPGTVESRASAWDESLGRATDQRTLRELYQGEAWSQVPRLEGAARAAGYTPVVLVASAGLGLRPLDHRAPAYAATFSTGHDDSVALTVEQAQDWWQAISTDSPSTLSGPMMWVLSKDYSKVIADDMLARTNGDPLLVFGGSVDVPSDRRVPSNRQLRRALGGTANSLNLRMAVQWLELSSACGAFSAEAPERWHDWCTEAERPESYNRARLSDETILELIQAFREKDPDITKSRALRQLRDSQLACEQRRFGTLFQQAEKVS